MYSWGLLIVFVMSLQLKYWYALSPYTFELWQNTDITLNPKEITKDIPISVVSMVSESCNFNTIVIDPRFKNLYRFYPGNEYEFRIIRADYSLAIRFDDDNLLNILDIVWQS